MLQTPFPSPPIDPNYVFSQLMPLISIATIVLVGGIGLRLVFKTPVGEAIARRIRGGRQPETLTDPGREADRAELEDRVLHLQERLGELEERLDFTERLLASSRDRQLGPER
jgi:hypothetical protein